MRASTVTVPNPKTQRDVRVMFLRDTYGDDVYYTVGAYDGDEHVGSSSFVLPRSKRHHWAWLDSPEVHSQSRGYGLCIYMASALFARRLGKEGISAGGLSHFSFTLWRKMYEHDLAECNGAPVILKDDATEFDYECQCVLRGDTVKEWIERWRADRKR